MSTMACIRSGACLAFLLGATLVCRMVEAAKPTVAGVTADCLTPANVARTGRLNVRLGKLATDSTTEAAAISAIDTNSLGGDDASTCNVTDDNIKPVSANVGGFTAKVAHNAEFSCPSIVSGIVTSGLAALTKYPGEAWDNGTAAPYNDVNVQNLMYLMYGPATGLGCGRTTNCTGGNSLLLCKLSPGLDSTFKKPILTEEFYNALKERQGKGIDLTKLGEADLDTDLEGKHPEGGKDAAGLLALPGVIPTTALTFTSLLGFASSVH